MSERFAIRCGLFPFRVAVGIDFREARFGSGSGRALQAFPEDLVVELGWNAVLSREVEVAGFRRPILHVVSWLQVRTGPVIDVGVRIEQRGQLQKRRCDRFEVLLAIGMCVEKIGHGPRVVRVQVEVLGAEDRQNFL